MQGRTLAGQWDISLRDLEHAIGLDSNGDGAISWGEVKARHEFIADYALGRLHIATVSQECRLYPEQQQVDEHSDGTYTVLSFASDCSTDGLLQLDYRLFFDLDPTHRGLLQVVYADGAQTAVLSPEQPATELLVNSRSRWQQFGDYWREGVWHIWIGFDHILFLLALLLPAIFWRESDNRRNARSVRSVLLDITAIVTAFTLAHSFTLSIAVLGWIALPSRWVESAIAATIVLAACNNLYPFIPGRRWLIAFVLGLIHGFGFASVLADLGLPGQTLALALAGFNIGVESGQLTIVLVFIPLAYLLRDFLFYRAAVLKLGSLAIAVMASVWLIERSFNIHLLTL
jgi:hypothetical protein